MVVDFFGVYKKTYLYNTAQNYNSFDFNSSRHWSLLLAKQRRHDTDYIPAESEGEASFSVTSFSFSESDPSLSISTLSRKHSNHIDS